MSRVFVDQDLSSWEAYVTSGRFGLPEHARILFNPLSNPTTPARFVPFEGDAADAEDLVGTLADERLREMLAQSRVAG